MDRNETDRVAAAEPSQIYDRKPSVVLVTDNRAAAELGADAVAAAGGRVSVMARIDEAAIQLEQRPTHALVVVDVSREHGEALDRVLDRLQLAAEDGLHHSLVIVRRDLLDRTIARLDHRDVDVLVEPSSSERASALAVAFTMPRAIVAEDREQGRRDTRLLALSQEVSRIAGTLEALSRGEEPGVEGRKLLSAPVGVATGKLIEGDVAPAAVLRTMIRLRRLRGRYFDAGLFADPAWDILLDLAAARHEGARVAVSSLCIAAAVPPTTALRWIKSMLSGGLLVRRSDPMDGRRIFIELSDPAAKAMDAYLVHVAKQMGSDATAR